MDDSDITMYTYVSQATALGAQKRPFKLYGSNILEQLGENVVQELEMSVRKRVFRLMGRSCPG